MTKEQQAALDEVLDIVDEWQREGRTGFCLPVLRGKQLADLEVLADERRRDRCTWCDGSGKISDGYEDMNCPHCAPLADA